MNGMQKRAWFGLVISVFLFVMLVVRATSIPVAVITSIPGTPQSLRFLCLVGICALVVSAVISIRKKSPSQVDIDERDKLISARALVGAHLFLWALLIAVCIVPLFTIGQEKTIPLGVLPLVLILVLLITNFVHSLAILVQYGRVGKGNNHE
jgi:hypothetical protein